MRYFREYHLRRSREEEPLSGVLVGLLHDEVVLHPYLPVGRLGPLPVVSALLPGICLKERGAFVPAVPADAGRRLEEEMLL